MTEQGTFRFGLADVTKPLLSVSEIVSKGHEVVLRADGGYIAVHGASGRTRRVPLKLHQGVFTVELKPIAGGNGRAADSGRPNRGGTLSLSPVDVDAAPGGSGFHGQARRP